MTAKHIEYNVSVQEQGNILAMVKRAHTDNRLNVFTAELDTFDYTLSDYISCRVLHNFYVE